jgi:hypothetical protein
MLIVRKRKAAQRERSPTNAVYFEREIYGECYHLYEELRNNWRGPQLYHGYARLLPDTFDCIATAVRDDVDHIVTKFQRPISLQQRFMLAIT